MPTADLPNWRTERGRVGALSRSRADDDPELVAARRNLKVARVADRIRQLVDEAPPLTDAQRAQLAAILSPTAPAREAA